MDLAKKGEEQGMSALAFWENGVRRMTNNKKARARRRT